MIKPTIGRVVWYYPGGKTQLQSQPLAALIAYVHSDTCINIGYFDRNGVSWSQTSVALEQEPGDADWSYSFCTWMPYQVSQAKKHEEPKS